MNIAATFQALADPTRLRLFAILAKARDLEGASGRGLCVAEAVDIIQRPQYAVSRALGELRKAGLAEETRHGRLMFYRLSDHAPLETLARWIQDHGPVLSPLATNGDGSPLPGITPEAYDAHRLAWRLALRQQEGWPVTPATQASSARLRGIPRVLFVCVHNSARSQLAEEYLRAYTRGQGLACHAESAGLSPGTLNPLVVDHLGREGIDIRHKAPRAVAALWEAGAVFDWVITVCDPEVEKDCPVFPGPVTRLNWPFPDPARFVGSPEEQHHQVEALARSIRAAVQDFADRELSPSSHHTPKEIA